MNKPIFQKIKKSNLQSINQSPYSQQQIQYMSVQDMEKTLLTHMNSSRGSSPQNVVISSNNESIRNSNQNVTESIGSRNSILQSRKVPDIVMQNDQLKYQIERLKSQKNMILSQYENLSTFNKNLVDFQNQSKQNDRQFSFRKSVQNAQKIISSQSNQRQQQKQTKQNIFKQRQLGAINQRNIPSSDSHRNSRQQTQKRQGVSLQSKGIVPNLRRSTSKQGFSTLEQRFYQYCKTQMVRMNTQNTKLTLKIGQLENKITSMHKQYELLEQENSQLKGVNQSLQQRLKIENQKIQQINLQMSVTLKKKQQIVESEYKIFQTQIKQLRDQQQKLRKTIQQKDTQITILKSDVGKKSIQFKNYTQMVSKNALLQNQLNEVMIRNKKLSDKFKRMPIIDHLWQIKQVEYQNLLTLIQKQKSDIQNLQSNQKRKSYQNAFDLSFSKQKNKF